MFPLPPWANPKNIAIVVLAIACSGLWLRVAFLDQARDTAVTEAKHQEQRAESLALKVVAADEAVAEAGAINGRMAATLQTQTQAIAALKRAADESEAAATEAQRKVLVAAAETRARDRARRERPDLPSTDEMNAALREAVEGL